MKKRCRPFFISAKAECAGGAGQIDKERGETEKRFRKRLLMANAKPLNIKSYEFNYLHFNNPRTTACVNPAISISFNPLMVIPPGVVTLSISCSGLLE